MTILEQVDSMITELNAIRTDAIKFDQGNGAAGIRVRKGMMEIKQAAQEVRNEISRIKAAK